MGIFEQAYVYLHEVAVKTMSWKYDAVRVILPISLYRRSGMQAAGKPVPVYGVLVGVAVGVSVGVDVAVWVGVAVAVEVAVDVAVAVAVGVAVAGAAVDVGVGGWEL